MRTYAALIIDLKKSRSYSIDNRNAIQSYIIEIIPVLNFLFRNSLEKDVAFSAGDEVQGLFSTAEASYLYFRIFNMLLSPVEICAGIGIGDWNIVLKGAGSTAQDGPAYHNARYAIEHAKESSGYSVLFYSGGKSDLIMNTLINAETLIINRHSEYQNQLMLLSELLYPIDANGIVDSSNLGKLRIVLEDKSRLNDYTLLKRRKSCRPDPFESIKHSALESVPVDAIHDDSTFFVTGGRKRGLSMRLSKLIGVSRQSIDKTIKTAHLYEARNAAAAVLKLMNMTGGTP